MSINPDSVKALLNSEEASQRISAVNQLRVLDRAIAFELILSVVMDENARVRYAAISQLSTLGHENLQKSLEILRDRLLNDSEVDVQAAAADSLGALQLTEAFDDLQNLYETTSEWLIKMSVVAALGELGDPRGFDLLTSALESEEPIVRTMAIGALGDLKDERAIPLILGYANDDDWQVRLRLVQALGSFGTPVAHEALGRLADDEMPAVAQAAQFYIT